MIRGDDDDPNLFFSSAVTAEQPAALLTRRVLGAQGGGEEGESPMGGDEGWDRNELLSSARPLLAVMLSAVRACHTSARRY